MTKIAMQNEYVELLNSVKARIRQAQYDALKAVNKELIALYWDIGSMIVERQEKEGWGKTVVERLAQDLQAEFPGVAGYSRDNLWRMRKFYLMFNDNEKLAPLVQEISWTKIVVVMESCDTDLEREFYIRMTRKFGWTKNVLIHQIDNKTYEKTLLNQTNFDKALPEKIKNQAKLAVKDEYTFDFLELDKLDTCREGFVAFSRAKELLCIACLEKLDSSALGAIHHLGIEVINIL